jgi:transposase-like protein
MSYKTKHASKDVSELAKAIYHVGIAEKRKKILPCTQETTRAKLEHLL